MQSVYVQIEQSNTKSSQLVAETITAPQDGELLVQIDKFGMTTNNITYVALGKSYQYFDFFPCQDRLKAKLNVWGVATVVQSKHAQISVGEKIYGYFPAAQYYCLKPSVVKSTHFFVSRPHLPADRLVYHQYFRAAHDPDFLQDYEDYMIIFRPLWGTSFFLNDFLATNNYFNSKTLVISSASSKTAYCFALLVQNLGFSVVGLTSASNVAFVKSLGLYSRIVCYDQLRDASFGQFVYVDVAGSRTINELIQNTFNDNLLKTVSVGMSHYDGTLGSFGGLSKANTVLFFAPDWIKQRLPVDGDNIRIKREQAWKHFLTLANRFTTLEIQHGQQAALKTFQNMMNGAIQPQKSFILSLHENGYKL
jgi:hypothetical protein